MRTLQRAYVTSHSPRPDLHLFHKGNHVQGACLICQMLQTSHEVIHARKATSTSIIPVTAFQDISAQARLYHESLLPYWLGSHVCLQACALQAQER